MLYLPDNGLQEKIAARMKKEITSEDTSWIEDKVREISSYDFNAFLYSRLTKSEYLEVLKYNFLLRYHGNRAPLTIGGHPEEYSARYDQEVILQQPGNEDYRDVLNYNTYADRKAAVREFIGWVRKSYGSDVYFLSAKELVEFMKEPFDKRGKPVPAEIPNSPACESFFDSVPDWSVNKDALGSNGSFQKLGPDSFEIAFTVGKNDEAKEQYCFVDVAAYFAQGALKNVSHIDIQYEAGAPFRIRLLPDAGDLTTLPMQVLLAGVGSERTARIRMKDFTPDPYAPAADIAAQGYVDTRYLDRIAGLSFENASTRDETSYKVKIKKIVLHGAINTEDLQGSAR